MIDYDEYWADQSTANEDGTVVLRLDGHFERIKSWKAFTDEPIRFGPEWTVHPDGDLEYVRAPGGSGLRPSSYLIQAGMLAGGTWISEMLQKPWVDMNHFIHAYWFALQRIGAHEVTSRIYLEQNAPGWRPEPNTPHQPPTGTFAKSYPVLSVLLLALPRELRKFFAALATMVEGVAATTLGVLAIGAAVYAARDIRHHFTVSQTTPVRSTLWTGVLLFSVMSFCWGVLTALESAV